ncbi:hypothetical protein [Bosea sp. (in: a-proteobacteria)]|uniref:hypothetical protein n=1 Tax=Bosea sp. (in: a-proteobacteria) TaxID=1871050 RepID=UPI003B3A6EB6
MTTTRIRKAWSVSVRSLTAPSTYYGATASSARGQAIDSLRDAWSLSWREALREIASCRRNPAHDVELPNRHPLAPHLHPGILHCVVHAYGGTGLNAGYRDHFYTSADDWQMKAALYHGLFRIHRREPRRHGKADGVMYELTQLGKNVARGEAETYPRW